MPISYTMSQNENYTLFNSKKKYDIKKLKKIW